MIVNYPITNLSTRLESRENDALAKDAGETRTSVESALQTQDSVLEFYFIFNGRSCDFLSEKLLGKMNIKIRELARNRRQSKNGFIPLEAEQP